MEVARYGEQADPRIVAPPAVRHLLRFTRLPSTAYAAVARAVDDDDDFRARVAAAADDRAAAGEAVADGDDDGVDASRRSGVGRAGWLWLHRPDGWASDPALAAEASETSEAGPGSARLRRERDGAEAAAARHRRSAEAAEVARRRAVDQLTEVRRETGRTDQELKDLRHRVGSLVDDRNRAVRSQKALEADLATARRDLKAAREASRQAEADLAQRTAELAAVTSGRVAGVPMSGRSGVPTTANRSMSGHPTPTEGRSASPAGSGQADDRAVQRSSGPLVVDGFDRRGAQRAVEAASEAVELLARALADAAGALAAAEVPAAAAGSARPVGAATTAPRGQSASRSSRRRRAPTRARAALPPGVIEDSTDAQRHLITVGEATVLVDGYNLARTAWSGLEPQEERRRTVALLEEVGARSGAPITVVFDGIGQTVGPAASRSVRVEFSSSGQTADEAIADLLAALPPNEPVVVVSSDREVADDARRQGAVALSSRHFLTAAGR